MKLAMLLAGLLIGFGLAVVLTLFIIMSMGGGFRENLIAAAAECRRRLTGRNRVSCLATPPRVSEADNRVRSLQEEIRVMQRLIEQSKVERQAESEAAACVREEKHALRAALTERDGEVANLHSAARDAASQITALREELAARTAELVSSRCELRDLQTELSVAESGAGLGIVSDRTA